MSPYSSVFRDATWGGLPVSLPAMGVFAFLLFFAAALPILGWQRDRRATGFLLLATLLPVLTSLGMGYLSLVTLDAVCKLCIGIYAASLVSFIGALVQWRRASVSTVPDGQSPISYQRLGLAFAVGVAFVLVPTGVYAAKSPDFERYAGACGQLAQMPSAGMLVALGPQDEEIQVVEVFDPLCPACRGFEERFGAQSASAEVSRQVLLFPLDDECNWMVDDAIHAGACAVSEAILCADSDSSVAVDEVVSWAFAEQEEIREASEADATAAASRARERFPALASCIGSPQVRARLNVGLRFAVENQIPIVTPQLFVNGTRMCDEDTDLGMDFILRRLIDQARADGIRPPAPPSESLAAPAPPPREATSARPSSRGSIELSPRPSSAGSEDSGGSEDSEESEESPSDEIVDPADVEDPDLAALAEAAEALEADPSESETDEGVGEAERPESPLPTPAAANEEAP